MAFLDENGVQKLWSRIQEYVYECGCKECDGGSVDVGYECQENYETLWQGNVTTGGTPASGLLPYTEDIDVDVLRVTFDGTVYECPKHTVDGIPGRPAYGGALNDGADFSEFPFGITSWGQETNEIITSSAGTHTVKLEVGGITATVTPCFKAAVKESVGDSGEPMMVQLVATKDQNDVIERLTIDADPQVLYDTFVSGKRILATIKPTTASETNQAVSEVVYGWRYASNGSVKYQFGLVGFEDATAGGNGYFKINAYTNVVSGEQVYHIVDHGE